MSHFDDCLASNLVEVVCIHPLRASNKISCKEAVKNVDSVFTFCHSDKVICLTILAQSLITSPRLFLTT